MSIQRIEHGSTNGYQPNQVVRGVPQNAALTRFRHTQVRWLLRGLAEARAAEAALQRTAPPTSPLLGPCLAAQVNNTIELIGRAEAVHAIFGLRAASGTFHTALLERQLAATD
jgi:hypothetical protein